MQTTQTTTGTAVTARPAMPLDDAMAYAERAARSALRHWRSGAADAADVASESLTRLLSSGRLVATVDSLTGQPDGPTIRQTLAATVRNVARETMAGRTRAERSAPLPVAADRVNGQTEDGSEGPTLSGMLCDCGAPVVRGRLHVCETADDGGPFVLTHTRPDGLTVTLYAPHGRPCPADWTRPDGPSVTVTAADGLTMLADGNGPAAVAILQRFGLQTTAAQTQTRADGQTVQTTRYATLAQDAATDAADTDAAVLSVSGMPWQDALAALSDRGILTRTGRPFTRSSLRTAQHAARKRAAGQTVNRK